MLAELSRRLNEIARLDDVHCVVLAANGPVFCAGMDLAQMNETAGLPDAAKIWRTDTQLYHDVVLALFQLSMTTLAVVQGGAVAGGLGLVLACDLVLAADSAIFFAPSEPNRRNHGGDCDSLVGSSLSVPQRCCYCPGRRSMPGGGAADRHLSDAGRSGPA